ncbi:MAG: hypothetical protein HPY71_11985 [Firmicutes bacterium]|nr:hypothetical protein [Bacillota bacterium]
MSQQELLMKVIEALERSEIDYMVTGSLVSSLQGEPRSTHDVDLVISMERTSIEAFVKAFSGPEFYLDERSILAAIEGNGMFNLLDVNEGIKVDFWMLTDDPFDKSRFSRKYVEDVLGIRMKVSSPEDTILAKLRWAKLSGGSEKQFIDALRVYEVQFAKLDLNYIDSWAKRLDIEGLWEKLRQEAEVI